jgi:hypothetical protein
MPARAPARVEGRGGRQTAGATAEDIQDTRAAPSNARRPPPKKAAAKKKRTA